MSAHFTTENPKNGPGKPFVILSKGRSGTNFLNSKLLLSKQILIGWEPFNKQFYGYGGFKNFDIPVAVKRRMRSKSFRDEDPDGYIDYCAGFTGALQGTGVRCTGFKIFPEHDEKIYMQMTRDTRFNALVVERASKLSAYSSMLIAKTTRAWIKKDYGGGGEGETKDEQVQVRFDKEQFDRYATRYRDQMRQTIENLEAAKVRYLKVYYEDLAEDPNVFRDIYAFLGLEGEPEAETWVKKQNDPNVLNRFRNPGAAKPFLEREMEEEAQRRAEKAAG